MKRRRFLQYGLAGGAAVAAGGAACRTEERHPAPPAAPTAASGAFELEEATIAGLQDGLESGRYTARALTDLYLARIETVDRGGPGLNSVIEVNPEARSIADALDAERKAKGPRGPLHGIPILIKDNIASRDQMQTTAGSLALVGSAPPADAFLVRRLREAGAVLLGKTNLSEWANFRSSRSTSGWSGRGGQTKNPYALDRNPCGSSSGSGAAAAANLCAASVGTETDGSIVCPSTTNGIVGIKPTLGLISRFGIIPIAHSQDTAGPMARTVADAAALLTTLAGPDPKDAATLDRRAPVSPDYAKFLDPDGLRGARLGVARRFFKFHDKVDAIMEARLEDLRRLGAVLVDPADFDEKARVDDSEFEVLLYEFKADLNAYLAWLGPGAPVHSLKEIIDFNEKNRDREMPYFGQELFLQAEAKGPLTDKAYRDALARNLRLTRTEGIDALMDKHRLDAIIAPTGGPAWTTDLVNGDHYVGGGCSTPPAVSGYPHVTVPAGFVFGLPVGLSFFGRAWSEPTLIKLAYAFEQATRVRRPPRFLPVADLSLPTPGGRP
jgi:amidase